MMIMMAPRRISTDWILLDAAAATGGVERAVARSVDAPLVVALVASDNPPRITVIEPSVGHEMLNVLSWSQNVLARRIVLDSRECRAIVGPRVR